MNKTDTVQQIAIQYAGLLKERLREHQAKDILPPEEKTSVHHLMWMCNMVMSHHLNGWSMTKAHRWIGYIQGVMTSRRLTTVERERDEYKKLKKTILDQQAPSMPDNGCCVQLRQERDQLRMQLSRLRDAARAITATTCAHGRELPNIDDGAAFLTPAFKIRALTKALEETVQTQPPSE